MKVKTQAERSEVTRQALVDVARGLFAERGYAATGTEDLVQRAGVTRGALYHHFRDKQDLFRAVVERVSQVLAERIATLASAEADPWRQVCRGCEAFLDACTEADTQRILLLDAPSVLGWGTWRQIDVAHGLGLLRQGLEAAMQAGAISRQPVDVLAHLLVGALDEAAMVIAHATDPRRARTEVGAGLTRLLEGLKPRAKKRTRVRRPSAKSRRRRKGT
jgi:AcrR family transcriptional regulator